MEPSTLPQPWMKNRTCTGWNWWKTFSVKETWSLGEMKIPWVSPLYMHFLPVVCWTHTSLAGKLSQAQFHRQAWGTPNHLIGDVKPKSKVGPQGAGSFRDTLEWSPTDMREEVIKIWPLRCFIGFQEWDP